MLSLKAGAAAAILAFAVCGVVAGNAAAMDADAFLWAGRGGGGGDYESGVKAARAGDWHMSLHYLKRSVRRDPQDADALTVLALSYRKLGRMQESMRFFEAALAVDPDHRSANLHAGDAYLAGGNLVKAMEIQARLTDLCPKGCKELEALKSAIEAFGRKGPDS